MNLNSCGEKIRRASKRSSMHIPEEPFFVKNLENVQGDERDVIFISIGYGRSADGRLTMNFGPLNQDGGERRLNVLITRARRRCEVFTNLTADDIDLNRTDRRGVAALKRYLKYAQTGEFDIAIPTDREADSPLEEAVANGLRELGFQVDHQVGSAGYFIDLSVKDPERPGRYLLGIECDGATYHSAQSARDRDRLRQQVLEGLGWRIHRIWSTDWFRAPDRELRKTAEAIEAAKGKSPSHACCSLLKMTYTRKRKPPRPNLLYRRNHPSSKNINSLNWSFPPMGMIYMRFRHPRWQTGFGMLLKLRVRFISTKWRDALQQPWE